MHQTYLASRSAVNLLLGMHMSWVISLSAQAAPPPDMAGINCAQLHFVKPLMGLTWPKTIETPLSELYMSAARNAGMMCR